jgi:signal transduction histidine kinase/CheY-like chemotaxis protein
LLRARLDDFIGAERAERDWEGFLTPERIAQGMLEDVWEGEQDGVPIVLEVRARPAFLPDRHLFVLRDITERRRLEDQLRQAQKIEAVGQLAGGIAHDFNNLLTVISGYGDIARRRIGAGPGAAELMEIERAAQRASELTRQLLAFARRQVLEPTLLDLSEVTRALMPMLGRLLGEDIEIAMLAAQSLPPVLADRTQIEQVIVNLAINARDAMAAGGTLTIETRAEGEVVCLVVADTGTGIAPQALEHIFEPFFTTKAVGVGTGLGLATVHGIVTQSQGRIEVVSDPGLGATFTVRLPAATATERRAAEPEPAARRSAGGETVLVCEDEDSVRRLIALVLVGDGYSVLEAAGPRAALRLAADHGAAIAAVITDVVMPEMSGLELAERLEPLVPGLRTLFVSGYAPEVLARHGRIPSDSSLLEKPFDHSALSRALRDLLDAPAAAMRDRPELSSGS